MKPVGQFQQGETLVSELFTSIRAAFHSQFNGPLYNKIPRKNRGQDQCYYLFSIELIENILFIE